MITWVPPATINATTPLGAAELNAVPNTQGTIVYSPATGSLLSPGAQTLSLTFTPSDPVHFAVTKASVNINVTAFVAPIPKNVQIIGGGYVDGVFFHPAQQNLRYARTDVGGAYRWDQSLGVWTPLLDFIGRLNSNDTGVESIGIDPNDPQRLYLSTGLGYNSGQNGDFYLSDDQGNTFTAVPAPFLIGSNLAGRNAGERFAVDPNLGTTIYYGSRLSGLWKSLDRGMTWNQVTSFPVTGPTSGVGVVFVTFVQATGVSGTATPVLYAGVSDTGTSSTGYSSLYRSIDTGATWQVVPGQPTGFYPGRGPIGADGVQGSLGSLYISFGDQVGPDGINTGAFYQYTPTVGNPGGAGKWTNITPTNNAANTNVRASGEDGGYGGVALDPEVPGVVMVSTMDGYNTGDDIYRSTNYGQTWVSFHNELNSSYTISESEWVGFGVPDTIQSTGNWPSSLAIDPFNSNHFEYGTGQTLWDSANLTVADAAKPKPPSFSVGALGIEETVVSSLISPTAGSSLVSAVGDLGGFVHSSLTSSPAVGAMYIAQSTPTDGSNCQNGTQANSAPILTDGSSLDFAQNVPLDVIIVGTKGPIALCQNGNTVTVTQAGFYATDGGVTKTSWNTISLPPGSTVGGGTVAIASDASAIVWATYDAPPAVSNDFGKTWIASAGAIQGAQVVADRVNPKKFYIYDNNSGTLQISVDGGVTFATQSTLPQYSYGQLTASFDAEGDLWLAVNGANTASASGLYHSTDSGATLTLSTAFSQAYAVGLGAVAAAGTTTYGNAAVYTAAVGATGYGFYRSIDNGATWLQVSDPNHLLGYVGTIIGDSTAFGRFYIGTGGRGIAYADTQ